MRTVGRAGIKQLKIFVTENTNGNNDNQYNFNSLLIYRLMEFKHPSYYKKLRANRQQATGNRPRADKQQAAGRGRVGPKGTSCQASGDSRINKR